MEKLARAISPERMTGWSEKRRLVGVAQGALNAMGHDVGPVDGYAGHRTNDGVEALILAASGRSSGVDRGAISGAADPKDLPRQRDIQSFYGKPATSSNMTLVQLPFDLRIDWNLRQKTSRMRVHKRCAASLLTAMIDVRDHYGPARWRALGLDRYAGGYVPRKMRGGTQWSMHAYGCAVDFYARPNGLRTRAPDALFSKPEYKPFLDIMENHNWLCGGRLWGADFMHFQQARL